MVSRLPESRSARTADSANRRAAEELAGRTVWCATALPAQRALADHVRGSLDWAAGVAADSLELTAPLDPADSELCAECLRDCERLLGERIQTDDLVLLDDPFTTLLAEGVRERGAHAVWHVELPAGERGALPREPVRAVDAYLLTWRRSRGRGPALDVMACLLPARSAVYGPSTQGPGMASVLADVVHDDRADTVGGTVHARPAVAAR